jgi:proline iminopeptidase
VAGVYFWFRDDTSTCDESSNRKISEPLRFVPFLAGEQVVRVALNVHASLRMILFGILVATAVGCRHQAAPRVPSQGYVTGAGGARIFYEVAGSGDDTVIVVHGGPGAGINDIRPDLEPLAKSHVMIFYDQRGGGRSELPDTTLLTPKHFVADLEAVREHLGLEQMSLVAQSFGAIVVAEYLRAHPHRVARMVFLVPTGPNREEAARFYQSQHATSDTAIASAQFGLLRSLMDGSAADPVAACREYEALNKRVAVAAGEFAGKKGSECDMPVPALRYYFRYTARLGPEVFGNWDFTHSFSSVRAPLLVIHGERDKRGLAMDRSWARAIPNGRLLVIPNSGRAAYVERPDAVFPAIDEFLEGRWPNGALPADRQ